VKAGDLANSGPPAILIRDATLADAEAMSLLRQASIRELCDADHNSDPAVIESWIGDPSPAKFIHLLDRADVILIVAELDGQFAGLAGLSGDLVTLNYVHPACRFQGVSKALMQALEARLVEQGIRVGRLYSTATALSFYRSIGWSEIGGGDADRGYPMEKQL
jgi:GNAT superfamily N-acetyltransferase